MQKHRDILTDPELVLSVVVKTGNGVRKLRSFVQTNEADTLEHIITCTQPLPQSIYANIYAICLKYIGTWNKKYMT